MRKNRILIVEDNDDDIELILLSLQNQNIVNELDIVKDGEEALEFIFRKGAFSNREDYDPVLILLDLNLPKIGGLDVLRRIKADERTKRIPVTIFTSSNQEEDVIQGYELGANSFIRKPVDYEKFRDAIEKLGIYWLLLNECPPR